jgi:hypothetical protein
MGAFGGIGVFGLRDRLQGRAGKRARDERFPPVDSYFTDVVAASDELG